MTIIPYLYQVKLFFYPDIYPDRAAKQQDG